MPTYRTSGAWGSGIGVNLTPAQVDANFFELRTDLDDVIANPPTANSIETIEAEGFTWRITLTDGTELDPLPVPVVYTVWRGDWAPFTLYSAADIFRVEGEGIFAVMQDHTSAATFDPDEAGGSPIAPYYTQLIGVSTVSGTLDDISDVVITGAADDDFIAWDAGSSRWTNRTTAAAAGILAPLIDLDDLGDVDAPTPSLGQVLTWAGSPGSWQPAAAGAATLDALTDVSVPSPSNGQVLTWAGSPTGWIAASPAAVPTTLDALTDVVVPTPATGDLLQFVSPNWINAAGSAISSLTAATAPFTGSGLMEVSEPAGSPATYTSKKITVDDLFNTRTLAGTTTLPGSGQITSTGLLGLGAAAAERLTIGGTFTTASAHLVNFAGVFASSVTTTQFVQRINATVSPTGASVATVQALGLGPTIGNSAANITTAVIGSYNVTIAADYTGTLAEMRIFQLGAPTLSNAGGVATLTQFGTNALAGATLATNNNQASGTYTQRAIRLQGITVSSAGSTVINRSIDLTVPGGNSSAGSTTNHGIYITGNGGTASGSPPGTVTNFAMLSDSTAASRIEGGLGVGVVTRNATTATFPYIYIPTCAGTPTGVPRNAAVGQTAMMFDDTAHKLWIYEQSTATWKGVVVA